MMTNNDIFKKLRVALQLRDDQIVEILELVDFRISKGEIGNFFRNEDHPKYVDCGDQVLRNFLNGLVIYLRGTKENPKNPMEVLKTNTANKIPLQKEEQKNSPTSKKPAAKKPVGKSKFADKKPVKSNPVERFKFKPGKDSK
jgi:hypothetical protein